MAEPNYSTLVSKPTPVKLEGASNYRSWAKDMEMVMLRMKAWTLVTREPPAVDARDDAWLEKDIWARSEIHLWCSPDQQDLIHDSTTAYESWKILKDQYSTRSELKTVRLKKDFASVHKAPLETCTDYVKRVKRIVSELRDCGSPVTQQEVAFAILMGLPKDFSALVITLTNMATNDSPLVLEKTVEAIYTEEMRLKLYEQSSNERKSDLENNPLALKHDTQYEGNLPNTGQGAFVARTPSTNFRTNPYPRRPLDNRVNSQDNQARLGVIRDADQAVSNPHFGKTCFSCGGFNHISSNCWHAHPELHPRRLRSQQQGNAYGTIREVKQEANVADEPNKSEKINHPVEFNMVMEEIKSREKERFTQQLNLLISDARSNSRRWLLDTGASSHFMKDLSKFRAYQWLDTLVEIHTGSGTLLGTARGEVELCVTIGKVVIKDVLLVPDLAVDADLLSIPALIKSGFAINFSGDAASIHKDNSLYAMAKSPPSGGLYFIIEYEKVEDYALAMQCIDRQPFLVWHCRLGHINGRTIRAMASSGKVTGMEIGDPSTATGERNIDCADCLRGSQHQTISRYPFSSVTAKLARISVDIAGPMRIPDCTWGYKFLLFVIDHFTRYTWVFPLISKSMALKALKVFQAHAENQANAKILLLQSDNGGEFASREFAKWTQDSGIEHITCAPYASSMNSYVERVIKSVITHASAMLWHSSVKEDMWALAAKASVYLHNRVPNRSLPNEITPHEMWYGTLPHVGHIRVWGCRAWAAIPKKRRTKWESKSAETILVGFYDTENLYQLWDIEKGELVKRRDVIFHEHVLGHPSLQRELLKKGHEITGLPVLPDPVLPDGDEDDDDDLEQMYLVVDGVTHRGITIDEDVPKSYENALLTKNAEDWKSACKKEHDAMIRNNVYEWVAHVEKDKKVLPSKWVFTKKHGLNGDIRYKARIVAGGHLQRKGIDFKETYAPIAKFVSLRILLTMLALNDWDGIQGDIVTAFLHGDLEDEIYINPPAGVRPQPGEEVIEKDGCRTLIDNNGGINYPRLVWKLRKSIYGLRQSPRCFYTKLDNVLTSKGYLRIRTDYGVWRKSDVILIVHVDDMLLLGLVEGIRLLPMTLSEVFEMKWSGMDDTIFVGLHIRRKRENKVLFISQEKYAMDIVARFGLKDANGCTTPMETKVDWSVHKEDVPLDDIATQQYQAAIGSLIYLMLGSRPDLAYAINKLAQYSSAPTERHWKAVKKILRFVKYTSNTSLVLGKRPSNDPLVGYFDAAYMDDTTDRHSTMGNIFFYHGCAVSWASKKQQTIALSTTEAEYLAGTEATKESVWIAAFLDGLGVTIGPVKLVGDNQGANALALNPEYHARTKHIHGRQRFISEMIEQKKITVAYIPTKDMIADILTKALPRESYERFMQLIGLQLDASTAACKKCGEIFRSRNDLHRHIRHTKHGVEMGGQYDE